MASSKKNMNIFTDRFKNQSEQPKTDWTKDFLYSVATTGTGISAIKPIIGNDPSEILEFSFGQPKIKRSKEKNFRLISIAPDILSMFKENEIKCCLCHRVIQYPSWYYSIRYTAKHFYYFVCADKQSLEEQKPNTHCYRR